MEGLSERDRAVLNIMFDPLQILGPDDDVAKDKQLDKEEETLAPKVLEILTRAINKAEEKEFDRSLQLFDEALKRSPNSSRIFNDRAQALRLAGRNREALENLNTAVELSGGSGKAGIRALCQRGLLHRAIDREDAAQNDFNLAARLGSNFARSQLVSLNPYAAMCNAMLRRMTKT